jgi:hypothetical protein
MRTLARTIAVAVIAAVPLVGFSPDAAGAKTVSPQQWMRSLCTALSDWQGTLENASTDLDDALSATTDLPTAKTTVVDFLSQAVDATDTAIADLRGAGVPDTTNGKKIRARLLKGFGKAQAIFAEAEANAEGLPTDDLTSFKQAGQGIAADISNGGNEVEAGFGGISGLDKGDKLGKAAKSVKACSFLTS